MQRAGCFDKMGVAADRSGHPCRVLGLAALTGAKPIFYFPAVLVGGVVPAMYFKQSSTCAGVMPCARSQSASRSSSFAVVSFMVSFLLLSGYSACNPVACRLLCLNGSTQQGHLSSPVACFLRFAQNPVACFVQVALLRVFDL